MKEREKVIKERMKMEILVAMANTAAAETKRCW